MRFGLKKVGFLRSSIVTIFVTFLVVSISLGKAYARLNNISLCEGGPSVRYESNVFAYKGEAYFCGNHIESGGELFRSNGTTEGTTVIKDIDIGPGSSSPTAFFEYNNFLFFFAETNLTGPALWRSDGTSSGTKLVRALDIPLQEPTQIIEIGNELLIHFDNKLVRFDGTSSGTYLVDVPVTRGFGSSLAYIPATSFIYNNGNVFFITTNDLYKFELSNNTSTLIYRFPAAMGGILPAQIVENSFANGSFLITDASEDDYRVPVLWESDGSSIGTVLKESNINPLEKLNNGLVFCGNDDNSLYFRRAGDQERTLLQEDIDPDAECGLRFLGFISNSIAFIVGRFSDNDSELWITGGSASSTRKLIDFEVNEFRVSGMTKTPNGVVFRVRDIDKEIAELWNTDGTISGTKKIANVSGSGFTEVSTGAFFHTTDNNQTQLWHTDGTVSGTNFVTKIPDFIDETWAEDQRLYFLINNILWHSDGTSAGTYQLRYETADPEIVLENANRLIPILIFLLNEE